MKNEVDMSNLGANGYWDALADRERALRNRRIATLFEEDPRRFETFSAVFDDMLLDYSKEKIDAEGREALFRLAEAADLDGWREKMFDGELVNGTEKRAARHNILRANRPPLAGVADMREQFLEFAQDVRSGERLGCTGKQFTDIVNIGIGGSYLGPRLAVEALAPFADGPRIHFVANVDPYNFHKTVDGLDPSRTLFLTCSKSFTTQETSLNQKLAMDWATQRLGDQAIAKHFCAITARPDAARKLGIAPENIFQIWDWAGGRFSIWSSMGLCAAIRVGRRNFEEFLSGGADMDRHFMEAPAERNLPVLMALVGIWRRNIQNLPAYGIAAYESRLEAFPEYVQQLEMESNGKTVSRDGAHCGRDTAPIVFGGAGTNTQHSFFQKLHQGTDVVPMDFLVGVETTTPSEHAQKVLLANCLAQSKALMDGRDPERVMTELSEKAAAAGKKLNGEAKLAPHMVCPGDRPSTTLMYRKLDPRTLGRLIALYEHKIFTQAVIWRIECFDQYGVEIGKKLANDLLPTMEDERSWSDTDPSTRGLLTWRKKLKNGAARR